MSPHQARPAEEARGSRWSRLGLAGLLTLTGIGHLVARRAFEAIIPSWVPVDRGVVNLAAAAAELTAAGLLARRRTRRAGGVLAFATLLAVYPANIQAAIEGGYRGAPGIWGSAWVAWARLPLQLPLLWAAWRAAAR